MNTLVAFSLVSFFLSLLYSLRALLERSRWKLKMSCALLGVCILAAAGGAGQIHPMKAHGIPLQIGGCVYTQDQPMVCN